MKPIRLIPAAALAVLFTTGCDRKSPDVAKQLAALEQKAAEATERQRELEQQIEDQKLAAERDAIERERMEIEDARAELERRQGEAAEAEAENLRQREQALAAREGKVELLETRLEEKDEELRDLGAELTERDRELAGREAVALAEEDDADEAPAGDYGMFYESLSSYGSWFETPDYGYVWQPVVVRDVSWRPYTRGRWACTDHGWTWISDEPFGWATYHYGRWALCRGRGWVWIPGAVWAPAWVSWRSSGSHIGWAPLPPETLAYTTHRWGSDVDVTFGIGSVWFVFVETRNFCRPIHRHCLPYGRNNVFYGSTVNITNIHMKDRRVICGGPKYNDLSRHLTRPIPFYRLEMDRHGRPVRDPLGMKPRFEKDRLRVSAPNMDADWNERVQPTRVKGRLETVSIEREQELRPEVTERYRKVREESRSRAEQKITELGGPEEFNKRRLEQLEENRRRADEQTKAGRDNKTRITRKEEGPKIHPPKSEDKDPAGSLRQQRDELSEKERPQVPTRRAEEGPRIFPEKFTNNDQAERVRKQRDEVAQKERERQPEPSRRTEDGPRIFPEKFTDKDQAERVRKQREELAQKEREQARRADDEARMRKHQEEQAAKAREQQKEIQRQREEARRQQMEDTQREQARQQQEEARRQRMEEARREQEKEQRREEARREQQREQAREQQREQARQQQEAAQREQERARQKRDEDEQQKRSRNR